MKGLTAEQKEFVDNEILITRKLTCPILPPLSKLYEDENYIYMTYQYFKGDDLFNISSNSKLEEIAMATISYHILKGLKILHQHKYFHGNLKLENIVFSTSKKDNEIFLINFKYYENGKN
jgi:serine/threonine protein kinase